VKNSFDDRCVHQPTLCSQLSVGSQCSTDENKCTCLSGHYRTQGQRICGMLFEKNFIKKIIFFLARAVGEPCTNNIDCGDFGKCISNQCQCDSGRKVVEVSDSYGRKIKSCEVGVGVGENGKIILIINIL
jgi:hypothetical protein